MGTAIFFSLFCFCFCLVDCHFVNGELESADGVSKAVEVFITQGLQALLNAQPQLFIEVLDDVVALSCQRNLGKTAIGRQGLADDAVVFSELVEDWGHLLLGHDEQLAHIPNGHWSFIVQYHEHGKVIDRHRDGRFAEKILMHGEEGSHEGYG